MGAMAAAAAALELGIHIDETQVEVIPTDARFLIVVTVPEGTSTKQAQAFAENFRGLLERELGDKRPPLLVVPHGMTIESLRIDDEVT